jgi:hypothetical protein
MTQPLPVPDFSRSGAIVRTDYFSDHDLREMRLLLQDNLPTSADIDVFIAWCSDFAQSLELGEYKDVTPKVMQNQFERLASARACQVALGRERLSKPAAEYLASLLYGACHGSVEPASLQHGGSGTNGARSVEVGTALQAALRGSARPAAALELTFEALAAVEAASRHAAESLVINRGFDIREVHGRQLVDLVLDAYVVRFDLLPPGGLSTWFADAMAIVGKRAGLVSGPKICNAAIVNRRP